jgi:O-antigen ligase
VNRRPERKKPLTKGAATASPPIRPIALSLDPLALSPMDWSILVLLVAALIIAPIWAAKPLQTPFTFWDAIAGPLVLILIALAFILQIRREWKRPIAIGAVPGLAGAFALMGAWATLSVLHSHAIAMSLNMLTALFAVLLAGCLVTRLARDRSGLLILLLAVITAGSIVAGIGIHEYLTFWKEGAREHRTFATFINPDFLAGYLLITLPITLALFSSLTEMVGRLTLGVSLILQSVCLLLTGSLAGVAVLFVALFVWMGLVISSGAASGRWKSIGSGLLIIAVGALLGFAPTRSRVTPSDPGKSKDGGAAATVAAVSSNQGHSVQFRKWTWIGTVRMVKANPLFGVGIGAFPDAYGRYEVTAYTFHAHNSYLQWAGEVGVPGILLLLTGFAAATAFAARILYLRRLEGGNNDPEPAPETRSVSPLARTLHPFFFEESRLLLAGLIAGILASLLHSLWDSDWYILANALTLSAALALVVALARDIAPLATQKPRTMGRNLALLGLLVTGCILWRAGGIALSRTLLVEGNAQMDEVYQNGSSSPALMKDQLKSAETTLTSAAYADPFDPEPHLLLASLYRNLERGARTIRANQDAEAQYQAALQQYQSASRAAPSGITYYQLGRFYADHHDWKSAIVSLQQALAFQPYNLQTLRALSETYLAAGQTEQARLSYQRMTYLETQPFGTVRAVPQFIETDFAYAHAGLAKIAFEAEQWAEAEREFKLAANILSDYWSNRNEETNRLRRPDKRQGLIDLYRDVLKEWQETLKKEGKSEDAGQIERKQAEVEKELRADKDAEHAGQETESFMKQDGTTH